MNKYKVTFKHTEYGWVRQETTYKSAVVYARNEKAAIRTGRIKIGFGFYFLRVDKLGKGK